MWRPLLKAFKGIWRDESFHEKKRFLRGVVLFRELNTGALALLARTLVQKRYEAGETVFNEGDVGRACFVVAEGKIRLSQKQKRTGQDQVIAEMGPGDFFGEMVLLDELPRSATAQTLEPTALHILYKSHLDALLTEAPAVASKILHNLARLLSARLRLQNINGSFSDRSNA